MPAKMRDNALPKVRPWPGAEIDNVVAQIAATPAAIAERYAKAFAPAGRQALVTLQIGKKTAAVVDGTRSQSGSLSLQVGDVLQLDSGETK